ncbi:hypothetical protein BHE90_004893 [Fusarium euwallaceae]|uniref:Fungal-type protein kinase domain-containing protein n=3 Tax=Fusarium solani species complex TaxID=232080 RepID=A0A3M2RDQ3_9HYPO|nr:hypothetical protein CDV36_015012 [Fusarium kuroshium]RSL61554.1 hypothetical protein CEP51_013614 [Fusarium floridanum]RTE80573.1 hypothetical protein BHE90_004893 [Fusarium euwallaceae]
MNTLDILHQHPNNHVHNERNQSTADKSWAEKFPPTSKKQMRIHTPIRNNGHMEVDWSAFFPERSDDALRRSQPSFPPNPRTAWRLNTEADMETYLCQEIVAPVLSKFTLYPPVALQCKDERGGVVVDYHFVWNGRIVLIGEIKRNLIRPSAILDGTFENKSDQIKPLKELRGYAIEYECPQTFCFDGSSFLGLQFRAHERADFKKCDVDCWIFPRTEADSDHHGYPIRDVLYRMIVQGIRRCQSDDFPLPCLGGLRAPSRMFFSGEPRWPTSTGRRREHPAGYERVEIDRGCICWQLNGRFVLQPNGQAITDSWPLWEEHTGITPGMTMDSNEDIYGED